MKNIGGIVMLYNNGYIVKDLIDNENLSIKHDVYRGLESYHNWPLEKEKDTISKELTKLAEISFEENNYNEIMTDVELLREYVNHCEKLRIKAIIMKIMSRKNDFVASEQLKETEILGYDCMAGDSVSYLAEIHVEFSDELEPYKSIKKSYNGFRGKSNSNGLLNTYDEVINFIEKRNKLLKQGINLEDYWEPIPVRLSLVVV
jgi:hypothetical protein